MAKRVSETAALGFLAARILEAAIIMAGVVSILSVVTLRQSLNEPGGADVATLLALGTSLGALHDWLFLLGPGLIPGVNALCLGYVMYRSRLVPRMIPVFGLIGGPLLFASATGTMFGLFDQVSVPSAIAVIPVAFWELSLGVWLVVRGFNASTISLQPVQMETSDQPALRPA